MRILDLLKEDEKPAGTGKPKIYLDMDGVLADFFHEYAVLAGLPKGSSYRDIPPAKADPTLNKMIGTDFFARLPKFPIADTIVNISTRLFGGYNICSSPLRGDHENSEKQKKIWIANNLNPHPNEIIITPQKQKYAKQADGTPNILIDDRGDNITKWEAAGGIGIKFQADENGLETIKAGLKRAFDIIKGRREHEPLKLVSKDRSMPVATQDEPVNEKKIKSPTSSQCAVKRLSNVRYAQCVSRGMKAHDSDHTAGTGKQGVKGSGVHLKGRRASSVKYGGQVKNYGGEHS